MGEKTEIVNKLMETEEDVERYERKLRNPMENGNNKKMQDSKKRRNVSSIFMLNRQFAGIRSCSQSHSNIRE